MRLHPMTRQAVNSIVLKHKPNRNEPDELEFEQNEYTPTGKIGDEETPKE
jgi:hypothetical protein